MSLQFSKDGKYFAQLSSDGRLKIWNTLTNKFEQEYTPSFHLKSPCTCLHFVVPVDNSKKNGSPSPRKKLKRKNVQDSANINPIIVLGTTSGVLLCYSIAKGKLECKIDSNTSQQINCLSWSEGIDVYSAAENNVLCWNLGKKRIKSEWKAGNDRITSILHVPETSKLLTASTMIKLWDIAMKEVLATFTAHMHEINTLTYISPGSTAGYFLSSSKGDRIVSCWSLNGSKTPVASFQAEDVVRHLHVKPDEAGATQMVVVTMSGVCHKFVHTLNGKSNKPLKAKTTLRIVCDSSERSVVVPIPIVAAYLQENGSVTISHGNAMHLYFENISLTTDEKVQCIIRKDPRETKVVQDMANTKAPIVGDDVHYLTPHTLNSVEKRRKDGTNEVPMETRLENLTLNKLDSMPKGSSLAHLLLQGMHSKDDKILKTVFSKQDENIIQNTVKRLPMNVIVPLVEYLTKLIQAKTLACQTGILWFKSLLQIHAGILVSNPELSDLLSPVMTSIESRLNLQTPLNKLRGRLDLLVSQINTSNTADDTADEALLVFNDEASSDSEIEGMEISAHSGSENEWFEDGFSEQQIGENGDVSDNDDDEEEDEHEQ